MKETRNGRSHINTYTYDENNRLTEIGYGVAGKSFEYDDYGRLTNRDVKYEDRVVFEENYTYKTYNGKPTGQIGTWQNVSTDYDVTYSYTYDDNGNITAISDGTNTTTYVYDSANQLIRENNQAAGNTWVWTYDDAGNILSRTQYVYTTGDLGMMAGYTPYTYNNADWGDLLTSFNFKTITYDAIGNPLTDGTWTYTWRHGRELSTMTNGTITVRNSYNPDGLRIAKIVNRSNGSETHRYTYNGGQLVYDIIRINDSGTISNLTILMSYDESGRPFMITYDNVSYYYLLNAQGDVVGIMDVSGDLMVSYTYDAWGNVLSITGPMASTMGQHNQLRYRGYVYDPETELYYLNSRYYNPEVGRFINADGMVSGIGGSILGYNLFSYCFNNPVNKGDPSGNWPKWLSGALNVVYGTLQAAAGAALGATVGWTGVGAVVAAVLVVNGAATVTQGVGQIVNSVTQTNTMREDNIIRTGVQYVGSSIGGDTGATVAGMVYDAGVFAATLYSPTIHTPTSTSSAATQPLHTTGTTSPKNVSNPGGSYTKLDNNGNIYSYTQFNLSGQQTLRIDFQGRAHAGILPHIHLYVYPESGGRVEYIFDLAWHLIN